MSAITPDPTRPLTPSSNLRRRMVVSRLFQSFAVTAAALAVGVLALLIIVIIGHGATDLSWSFISGDLPTAFGQFGGIGPALLGTLEMCLIAAVISVPIGVLTAMYVHEFAGNKLASVITAVLEMLAGIPHIVIGLFVYAAYVEVTKTFSGLAGALAMAIIMAPVIARSAIESFERVPESWRDASNALGISRWRAIRGLVMPGASAGIVTASMLATARAAGDAAPVLFTTGGFGATVNLNPLKPMASLPLVIYQQLVDGTPASDQVAWGGGLVLVLIILCVNICARIWLRRGERKRGL